MCEKEEIKYAIKIPKVLSFLVSNDFNAEVKGLKDFPRDEWPPIAVTQYAFQIMILPNSLGIDHFDCFP